jgi:glycosyltransferase involved in cell wall biosynthesis
LDAAYRIRQKIPGFQLLVAGAGPQQEQIEEAARRNPWIHYLGPLQDRKKAVALVLADVMLNPGLVGLGILDSFTSGTPMFTTDCGLHSPEISYLSSGSNGVMTRNDVNVYADAVADALLEPEAIARLSKGALSSAPKYTIENMADRIRMGICACLSS